MLKITKKLIKTVVNISKDAGKAIMDIYKENDTSFEYKLDKTPVTNADLKSHNIIKQGLDLLAVNIPILSEEDANVNFEERSKWLEYWLIDHLDGTKEFLNRNGEFTVNIALMRNNKPIFGVIYSPVTDETFWGAEGYGSYQITEIAGENKIMVSDKNKKRIACSRSHQKSSAIEEFADQYSYKIIRIGSSYKFCMLAKGNVDVYPRIGPTSEWDIAAGHAILKYSGGVIIDFSGKKIVYNKKNLLNPNFIAASNKLLANNTKEILTNEKRK